MTYRIPSMTEIKMIIEKNYDVRINDTLAKIIRNEIIADKPKLAIRAIKQIYSEFDEYTIKRNSLTSTGERHEGY